VPNSPALVLAARRQHNSLYRFLFLNFVFRFPYVSTRFFFRVALITVFHLSSHGGETAQTALAPSALAGPGTRGGLSTTREDKRSHTSFPLRSSDLGTSLSVSRDELGLVRSAQGGRQEPRITQDGIKPESAPGSNHTLTLRYRSKKLEANLISLQLLKIQCLCVHECAKASAALEHFSPLSLDPCSLDDPSVSPTSRVVPFPEYSNSDYPLATNALPSSSNSSGDVTAIANHTEFPLIREVSRVSGRGRTINSNGRVGDYPNTAPVTRVCSLFRCKKTYIDFSPTVAGEIICFFVGIIASIGHQSNHQRQLAQRRTSARSVVFHSFLLLRLLKFSFSTDRRCY
jgi:hypothetical protein